MDEEGFYSPREEAAMCLSARWFRYDAPTASLVVDSGTSDLLRGLPSDTPLAMVGVYGGSGGGKSTLLGELSGSPASFPVGHNYLEFCTTGCNVFVETTPHTTTTQTTGKPTKVWADNEGSGTADGEDEADIKLFLAGLIGASVSIYNDSKGKFCRNDLLNEMAALAEAHQSIEHSDDCPLASLGHLHVVCRIRPGTPKITGADAIEAVQLGMQKKLLEDEAETGEKAKLRNAKRARLLEAFRDIRMWYMPDLKDATDPMLQHQLLGLRTAIDEQLELPHNELLSGAELVELVEGGVGAINGSTTINVTDMFREMVQSRALAALGEIWEGTAMPQLTSILKRTSPIFWAVPERAREALPAWQESLDALLAERRIERAMLTETLHQRLKAWLDDIVPALQRLAVLQDGAGTALQQQLMLLVPSVEQHPHLPTAEVTGKAQKAADAQLLHVETCQQLESTVPEPVRACVVAAVKAEAKALQQKYMCMHAASLTNAVHKQASAICDELQATAQSLLQRLPVNSKDIQDKLTLRSPDQLRDDISVLHGMAPEAAEQVHTAAACCASEILATALLMNDMADLHVKAVCDRYRSLIAANPTQQALFHTCCKAALLDSPATRESATNPSPSALLLLQTVVDNPAAQ
jgi:hypothetical protein